MLGVWYLTLTKELARLKKENRDLKDAVEILKKAMSIVSSQ